MKQREAPFLPCKLRPQELGVIRILLELFLEQREQPVIGADELLTICSRDL
jgi:hypothetical protein